MLYTTRAIVLRRRELGDTDLLITLLSPDRGHIKAVAKGSRRVQGRLVGKLEPSLELHAQLATGRQMDVLTEVKVLHPRTRIRSDLTLLAASQYLLEIFDKMAQGQSIAPTYPVLSNGLRMLEAESSNPMIVLRWCELHLMNQLGYRPETRECMGCGQALDPDSQGWRFHVADGGIVCRGCSRELPDAMPVNTRTLRLCNYLLACNTQQVLKLKVEAATWRPLEALLMHHLQYRMPFVVRSRRFLDEVARL